MAGSSYLFTSESVSEGHPDKVCDRISDEIVDLYFREALAQGFPPKDLRVALNEASGGRVGGLADAILLYCFCYDPATGKYGLAISRLLKTGGGLTVLVLGSFVMISIRRERGRTKTL